MKKELFAACISFLLISCEKEEEVYPEIKIWGYDNQYGTCIASEVKPTGGTYQWYEDGEAISGADSPTYLAYQGGHPREVTIKYTCQYTIAGITVMSNPVTLNWPGIVPKGNALQTIYGHVLDKEDNLYFCHSTTGPLSRYSDVGWEKTDKLFFRNHDVKQIYFEDEELNTYESLWVTKVIDGTKNKINLEVFWNRKERTLAGSDKSTIVDALTATGYDMVTEYVLHNYKDSVTGQELLYKDTVILVTQKYGHKVALACKLYRPTDLGIDFQCIPDHSINEIISGNIDYTTDISVVAFIKENIKELEDSVRTRLFGGTTVPPRVKELEDQIDIGEDDRIINRKYVVWYYSELLYKRAQGHKSVLQFTVPSPYVPMGHWAFWFNDYTLPSSILTIGQQINALRTRILEFEFPDGLLADEVINGEPGERFVPLTSFPAVRQTSGVENANGKKRDINSFYKNVRIYGSSETESPPERLNISWIPNVVEYMYQAIFDYMIYEAGDDIDKIKEVVDLFNGQVMLHELERVGYIDNASGYMPTIFGQYVAPDNYYWWYRQVDLPGYGQPEFEQWVVKYKNFEGPINRVE